jgi:hypothetical protein
MSSSSRTPVAFATTALPLDGSHARIYNSFGREQELHMTNEQRVTHRNCASTRIIAGPGLHPAVVVVATPLVPNAR